MHTETTITATPASTTSRKGRTPKREQLDAATAAAAETLAETTAAAKPAFQPTDEQRARIEKEKAKLEKEEKAAARRKARLEALERGEELPTPTKGLPPVVKMNELGALARQLHRAYLLAVSDDAVALMTDAGIGGGDVRSASYALKAARDEAIRRWNTQHTQRATAGAAENETLAPLGLIDQDGEWVLVEKKSTKEVAATE